MQKRANNNAAYYVSIIMIVLFFGCSVQQTHRTLTFFFDGVDKVIFYNSYQSDKDSIRKDAITRRDALLKKNRPDMCVHQPYKEKKCDQCHTADKRLLMPMPDLCFKCHKNFNQTYAVVHGPVASGGCLNCHNQHSSKNPKLLIRQGQQICLHCHNSSLVFSKRVHRDIEDAECTLCHNPHGGKTRFMIKDNIPRDPNRIALLNDLTYRHLYGQVFCKVPGDVKNIMEITVLDTKGNIVAIAHPDQEGRFFITNLHPDENYTFRFKNNIPDCKINILDNNGALLNVIDKNKKGNYVFDKTAYETAHGIINDSHILQDTLITTYSAETEVKTNIDVSSVKWNAESPGTDTDSYKNKIVVFSALNPTPGKGKIAVANVSDSVTSEEILNAARVKDSLEANVRTDTVTYKGKTIVRHIPKGKSTEELMGDNKALDSALNKGISGNNGGKTDSSGKGKIIVKTVPDNITTEEVLRAARRADTAGTIAQTGNALYPGDTKKKSNIIISAIEDTSANASVQGLAGHRYGRPSKPAGKYTIAGKSLPKISEQIFRFDSGIVVWVLNDAGSLLGTGKVNTKGNFRVNGELPYYHITLPPRDKTVVSQVVYLNEEMELIEIVDKKDIDGHITYSHTTKNNTNAFKLKGSLDNNSILVAAVNFEQAKTTINTHAKAELDKVIYYLLKNQDFRVFVMGCPGQVSNPENTYGVAINRVGKVVDYLIQNGVNHERITGNVLKQNDSTDVNIKTPRVEIYIKDDGSNY